MSNYTNQANIEGYMKRPLSTAELEVLQVMLDGADATIDLLTDRTWSASDLQTRFYDEIVGNHCEIEDAQSITEVCLLDISGNVVVTVDPSLYKLVPYNYESLGQPINSIYFPTYGYFNFPRGIRVKGTFGSANTPPDDIVLAATILCSDMYNNPAGYASEMSEGYKVDMGTNAANNPHFQRIMANRGSRVLI